MLAEFTVREQHVRANARMAETGLSSEAVRAAAFADSVGIGHYNMDLHLTTRGDRGQYGATLPFQIPLGALISRRVENLLPACKNIGESVGLLVAFCLARRHLPRGVRADAALREDFQRQLERDGIPLAWPSPLPG